METPLKASVVITLTVQVSPEHIDELSQKLVDCAFEYPFYSAKLDQSTVRYLHPEDEKD